jgi:hypothetical protein
MDQYNIELKNTYNMDEKGVMIGIIGRSKRIFSKRMWEKKEVRAALQDGSREWISLLACICADGTKLPPGLVFASPTGAIQSTWVEEIKTGIHDVFVTSSPTG